MVRYFVNNSYKWLKEKTPDNEGKCAHYSASPQGVLTQPCRHSTNTHCLPDPPAHSPLRQCVPGMAVSTTFNLAVAGAGVGDKTAKRCDLLKATSTWYQSNKSLQSIQSKESIKLEETNKSDLLFNNADKSSELSEICTLLWFFFCTV